MVPLYSLPTELDELAESGQDSECVRTVRHILAKALEQAPGFGYGVPDNMCNFVLCIFSPVLREYKLEKVIVYTSKVLSKGHCRVSRGFLQVFKPLFSLAWFKFDGLV